MIFEAAGRWSLAAIAAGLFWASATASGSVVAPGGTIAISGTNFPGLVIQDVERSLTLSNGTIITIQDRITQVASGNLSFDRVIRNTSDVPIVIKDLVESGFSGFTTDVDFDPTSTGLVSEPHTAVRDGAGNTITFTQMTSPTIASGDLSRFMTDLTNASAYALTGTTTVDAFTAAGCRSAAQFRHCAGRARAGYVDLRRCGRGRF